MKKLFTFWLALFFWGCTSPNTPPDNTSAPHTADSAMQHVYIQEDTHQKMITFPPLSAPSLPNYQDVTGMSATQAPTVPYGIVVIQSPNTPDMYIVYVSESENSGPLKEARAENGNKLPIIPMGSLVNTANSSATISGNFGIQINLAFLEKNRHRNPRIKVLGQQNSFVIFLPDYYIDGVLQYLRQH